MILTYQPSNNFREPSSPHRLIERFMDDVVDQVHILISLHEESKRSGIFQAFFFFYRFSRPIPSQLARSSALSISLKQWRVLYSLLVLSPSSNHHEPYFSKSLPPPPPSPVLPFPAKEPPPLSGMSRLLAGKRLPCLGIYLRSDPSQRRREGTRLNPCVSSPWSGKGA